MYVVTMAAHLDYLMGRREIPVEEILKLDLTWARGSGIGGHYMPVF